MASSIPTNETTNARFAEVFGHPATISARAPGRINLIGEHVDYQGGLVMPTAIDRYVFAAAAPIPEPEVRIWSAMSGGDSVVVPLDQTTPLTGESHWANYVFGVVAKYRDAGHKCGGFEIAIDADLPAGAGLSSSAALESATALVVEALAGIQKLPKERALLCQAAEHAYAGVPCGIMDQLAVNGGVAGHGLAIDCRTLDVTPSPLPAGIAMVVVDSKVKHALADGEYGKRKADCVAAAGALGATYLRGVTPRQVEALKGVVSDQVYRRARHVVTEIVRVQEFARALEKGDLEKIGELMAGSHASLRDDFEVSCAELDQLVEIANEAGVIGSRMTGGGFGGSTVNLVKEADAESVAQDIVRRYKEKTGADVEAFVVHAVAGANLVL